MEQGKKRSRSYSNNHSDKMTANNQTIDMRRSLDTCQGHPSTSRTSFSKQSFSSVTRRRNSMMRAFQCLDSLTNRNVSKEKQPGHYIKIFRKSARFLIIFLALWKKHADKVNDFLQTNVRMVNFHRADDVLFDVRDYRSQKQCRISTETARILAINPALRSEHDIHLVEVSLRNYPSIAACPVRIQNLIAKHGWFSRYVGRRVIIRQGHVARNFYFILSGSVIITRIEHNSSMSRTLCYLKRGDSFGELALNDNTPRSATAIGDGTVELLVYSEMDYWAIFRYGGVRNISDPIFKNSICLKNWPIEHLIDNEEKAIVFFFRRGQVIVNDINSSPWIYFIKSGTCTLLKRILNTEINLKKPSEIITMNKKKCVLNKMDYKEHENYIKESLDELNIKRPSKENELYDDSTNKEELFIAVQSYSVGDVFGLAGLVHDLSANDSSNLRGMSFVSNGAECMMVDKKLFMSHSSANHMQLLRSQVQPYPTKEKVIECYSRYLEWDRHKTELSNQVVSRAKAKREV